MAPETAIVDRPRHPNQYPPAVTKAKQAIYLKTLATCGIHSRASQAADVALNQSCQWASKNKEFAKAYESAKIAGERVLLLAYESNLDTVLLPETDMSLDDFARLQNSRFFRMKRLDPQYRDNAVVQVNAVGPVAIQLNFGTPALTQTPQAGEQA